MNATLEQRARVKEMFELDYQLQPKLGPARYQWLEIMHAIDPAAAAIAERWLSAVEKEHEAWLATGCVDSVLWDAIGVEEQKVWRWLETGQVATLEATP